MLPEYVVPKVKHGGCSVMIWGCFSNSGIGDLVEIDIMKKEEYNRFLKQNAVPSGLQLNGAGFVFQPDNDPNYSYAEITFNKKQVKIF